GKLNPKPLKDGGAPAIHFKIETAMMNQHLESWLMADDPQHGNFSMGLANIELKRGSAPTSPSSITSTSKNEEKDLEESIFAFSKAPAEQPSRARDHSRQGRSHNHSGNEKSARRRRAADNWRPADNAGRW